MAFEKWQFTAAETLQQHLKIRQGLMQLLFSKLCFACTKWRQVVAEHRERQLQVALASHLMYQRLFSSRFNQWRSYASELARCQVRAHCGVMRLSYERLSRAFCQWHELCTGSLNAVRLLRHMTLHRLFKMATQHLDKWRIAARAGYLAHAASVASVYLAADHSYRSMLLQAIYKWSRWCIGESVVGNHEYIAAALLISQTRKRVMQHWASFAVRGRSDAQQYRTARSHILNLHAHNMLLAWMNSSTRSLQISKQMKNRQKNGRQFYLRKWQAYVECNWAKELACKGLPAPATLSRAAVDNYAHTLWRMMLNTSHPGSSISKHGNNAICSICESRIPPNTRKITTHAAS